MCLLLQLICNAPQLDSIEIAYAHIVSGIMDSAIAGGIESSSLQPERVYASEDDREEVHIR